MITIIELPQVGESVTEGVISKWLKRPGDRVKKYDPLVEVMTDKVNMEVPSPFTGKLTKTLVDEGDTVPMGEPIAEMEVEGETPATAEHAGEAERFEFLESVRSVGPTGSGKGGFGRRDAIQEHAEEVVVDGVPATREDTGGGAGKLSPIVRRLVAEHAVDVEQLTGTGIGGRITKDDVLAFVAERQQARGPADETTVLPLTPLRKTIAAHLARSAREIPAAWSMVEVDVTGLVRYRETHKESFERTAGVALTYLPFAAQAVAQALLDNAMLNGRWDGGHITLNSRVNLGIAVSTEQGLVVPVVHGADLLNVEGLALRIAQVVDAARSGDLKLDDVQGGTFTLNNTGALGSVVSAPIINHPQAAIMTTEAIVKRAVVVEADAIAVRSMMNLCLTFDHRVCDGAEAARFLDAVKSRLESIDKDSGLL